MDAVDQAASSSTAALPPDGTIIRVSEWRQQAMWVATAIFAFFAFCILVYAAQRHRPIIALASLGYGFAASLFARSALAGIILEPQGVKARGIWRTYHWRWEEVERFELR